MNLHASVSGAEFIGPGATRALPVKRAVITASSANNNEIVAAVSGYHIRVLSYNYVVNAAVNAAWRSGTTTVIGGLGYWDAQGKGKVAPHNKHGWFQTASGEALNLHLSGAVAVGGECTYIEVPA